MNESPLSMLPSVDEVLRIREIESLCQAIPREAVVRAVRAAIEIRRRRILSGQKVADTDLVPGRSEVEGIAARALGGSLRRVVNATGVVIHTNLGRAPLPASALEEMASLASGYMNLEYDLGAGARGSRYDHIVSLLAEVVGAESAHVVNNNAAALLLVATALATGREIVVSRGELIEIGDGFRIPDVIRQGGALLREVGTTNRTRISDYEAAIGERTAVLAKIHRSNFYQEGFTEDVAVRDLASLGRRAGLVTLYDAGSGLLELPAGLEQSGEPALARVLGEGVDIVTASGDKLLGGPQAGIIVGRREIVEALRRHPLTRALRPCKLTIGILHHVLSLYREGRSSEVPVMAMLSQTPYELEARATRLVGKLAALAAAGEWIFTQGSEASKVGGGALPREMLDTWVVRCVHARLGAMEIEERLRAAPVPVVGRILKDVVVLDMRTVREADLDSIVAALGTAA